MFRLKLAVIALLVGAMVQTAFGQGEPPPPPPKPQLNLKVLRKLKFQFEREPRVEEVHAAALRFFKVHPELVDRYRAGASWKALVPDITVSFNSDRGSGDRRLVDMLYVSSPQFANGKDFEYTNNSSMNLSVQAHWALDRLIFNSEVLDVTSLVGLQESLFREVTSLYFTRQRLMAILKMNPPQDPGEVFTEGIRLKEIDANLNALTGGWFKAELKKRQIK